MSASKRSLCPWRQMEWTPLRGYLRGVSPYRGFRFAPPAVTDRSTSSRPPVRHGIHPTPWAIRDVRDAGNDVSMQANPRLDGRAPLPSRGTSCQDAAEGRFRRTQPCKPLVHWLLQTLPEKCGGSVLPSVFFVVALQRCSMRCAQTTGNNHGGEVLPPPLRETH